jgi:DNA-binding MarR family transcriptional regulator
MSTSRPAKQAAEARQSLGPKTRSALIAAVLAQTRELGTRESLYGQAVADQLGMNPTDLECGDLLAYYGPMTAGRLAELVGLTTGAITGVIDRLERVGLVRRERDPNDRRRVIVHAESGADLLGEPTYVARREALADVASRYTDQELAVVVDFLERANQVLGHETRNVRGDIAGAFAEVRRAIDDGRRALDDAREALLNVRQAAKDVTQAVKQTKADAKQSAKRATGGIKQSAKQAKQNAKQSAKDSLRRR